ncbi:MAG: hypothetical protein ACOX4N_00155 [Dethiobacteraceae bacterium]|jgi:hypothetical protein
MTNYQLSKNTIGQPCPLHRSTTFDPVHCTAECPWFIDEQGQCAVAVMARAFHQLAIVD